MSHLWLICYSTEDKLGFLLVHEFAAFVSKEGAVVTNPEFLEVPILFCGVYVATLYIIRQKDGLGTNLFKETAKYLYITIAAVAVDWTAMTPSQTDTPLFFVCSKLCF